MANTYAWRNATKNSSAVRPTISNCGAAASTVYRPPALPRATTKPAITFNIVWPASMLANRRIERLIGRAQKDMISSGTRNSTMARGAFGTNNLKKPSP